MANEPSDAEIADAPARTESLTLKWGVPKSWRLYSEASRAKFQEYADFGWSASAMMQPNTDNHRRALCELIDILDADFVWNDWTGDKMTKDDAKKYVMEYRK